MEEFTEILVRIRDILQVRLFDVGDTVVTLWTLLYLGVLVILLFYITDRLRRWILSKLPSERGPATGAREATAALVHYMVLLIGLMIILQTAGVDLTILAVITGSLGIGVGFGLQNIISNFVSGLIILFERPIQVGDRIEIDNVHGRVTRIGARSSTVITNDNIAIIIPNSQFITSNVVNWSHGDGRRRFPLPLSVPLGSDIHLVERLLIEAAREVPEVLEEPAPGVRFLGFNESGMQFELRAWSRELIHRRGLLTSKVYFKVYEKLNAHGIAFANPQRDVHIVSDAREEPE